MSIKIIHLNKLLKAIELPDNELTTLLRVDIRGELAKESGKKSSGGDFYMPFWSDVKQHVAGNSDLQHNTAIRVEAHRGRKRLYTLLNDGFLNWWNNKRRWRNETHHFHNLSVKARFRIESLDSVVKVENLLGLSIGEQDNRLIYPYLYEEPVLSDKTVRLGLWLLSSALSEYDSQDIRILDVMRSNSFSVADIQFHGNEKAEFIGHFSRIIDKWEMLKLQY